MHKTHETASAILTATSPALSSFDHRKAVPRIPFESHKLPHIANHVVDRFSCATLAE